VGVWRSIKLEYKSTSFLLITSLNFS
jgi:hypothetical protein